MKTISIIGAGSHTRSSINLLINKFIGCDFVIFDNSFDTACEEFIHDIKIVGKVEEIDTNSLVFLSVGDNKQRAFYFNKFNNQIIKENIFHKTTILENFLQIGESNQIFANVYINSYVKIGNNNIINTSVILEHEVEIGNNNHISVGVNLCGRVRIGNNCMIGSGVTIIDKISICDDVTIGAGAVVINDISASGTYVGIPARKIK